MKRSTIITGIVGIVCGVLATLGCQALATKDLYTRMIGATATAKYYYEDGDYTSMEFTDETGNMWIVDDYACNLGAEVLLTLDTKGTEEIEDDEIVAIGVSITVDKE